MIGDLISYQLTWLSLVIAMAVRLRKFVPGIDPENGYSPAEINSLHNKNKDLEQAVTNLKQTLEVARIREKKLIKAIDDLGGSVNLDSLSDEPIENVTFYSDLLDRGTWLIGLLIFQSCSSFILSSFEDLLQRHPSIVYFLTMLVGAGGNAGNQAAVRVIRELAIGKLKKENSYSYIGREIGIAFALSALVGAFGFIRVYFFSTVSFSECIGITFALISIVLISVIIGTILPLLMFFMKMDPANSSTTIQVIMDITGVLITCMVATTLLDTAAGKYIMTLFGVK